MLLFSIEKCEGHEKSHCFLKFSKEHKEIAMT